MTVREEQLRKLRDQLDEGFKISEHSIIDNIHYFVLPALEFDKYLIAIPESNSLKQFMKTSGYKNSFLVKKKVGVALLDLEKFSAKSDEIQLKTIVRYQCEVRKAIHNGPIEKMISIGDGTIFIFNENELKNMLEYICEIDRAIANFNMDFSGDPFPKIHHRIGIHCGYAYMFKDINKDTNYIGSGINIAQRISTFVPDYKSKVSFEESSPIYISKEAHDEFVKYKLPQDFEFTDLGSRKDKHGASHHVYAFHKVTRAS